MSNTDPISFNTPSRSYVNSHPKYYPDISYHGYDISRDISEYPVGEVNNDSSSITVCNLFQMTFSSQIDMNEIYCLVRHCE